MTRQALFRGKFIPETRCSVPKRAIGDFQRGPTWWTRKSDGRRRTCAVTRLNRDQVVEILRLISCENLVCDRKEFIFDTFIYSEPVKRLDKLSACELVPDLSTKYSLVHHSSFTLLICSKPSHRRHRCCNSCFPHDRGFAGPQFLPPFVVQSTVTKH